MTPLLQEAMLHKCQTERKLGDERKPRPQPLHEIKLLKADKMKQIQQSSGDKLKVTDHKKDKDKQFLERLEDDLNELGRRERMTRQKAKDEARKHNEIVTKQICQRCCVAEKGTLKMCTEASQEIHVAAFYKID